MLCKACREGGKMNTAVNAHVDIALPSTLKILQDEVKGLHSQCRGGMWCDCQHVVGQALNLQLVGK